MNAQHAVLVSTGATARHARTTARSLHPHAAVHVLDVDGSYVPVADEVVLRPHDIGLDDLTLHRAAVVRGHDALVEWLRPQVATTVATGLGADDELLCVGAGVLVLAEPPRLPRDADLVLVPRVDRPPPDDGRHPDAADLAAVGSYDPHLLIVRAGRTDLLAVWRSSTGSNGVGPRWLDAVAATTPTHVPDGPRTLLSAWSLRPGHVLSLAHGLTLDGAAVLALDLTHLDPAQPWRLDAADDSDVRGRLSEHPVLAAVVADAASRLAAEPVGVPGWTLATTSLGHPLDATLRAALTSGGDAPDPFDPGARDELRTWLTTAAPDGGPGRYLQAIRATRPDLAATFGDDTDAFLGWAAKHAVLDGFPAGLVEPALAAVRPQAPAPRTREPGVNVVGFLRGELGIGESARLLVGALEAAGVPCRTRSVDQHLRSRQRLAPAGSDGAAPTYDTTVICVNADLTPAVAASVPDVVERTYRIGMWYWEVEDFPVSQHGGFAAVDEVWVATDFVRAAVEPHSPVPVRTLTPPLPQRRVLPPGDIRTTLGLPDRFVFLFVFDYLSTFERKNPLGLVDAFTRAFATGEGPVLVLKSINSDQCPAQAERLRLAVASRSDIILLEDYLSADERDALMAAADCYVSLHRSEGLGLTMAEAMAWGRPVIATRYSGNLQFMTDENSFLVPWRAGAIPDGADPYPAGGVWAEPDLDAAAGLLRRVVEDPDEASARGARAAADIRDLHSAAVAGNAVAARLTELAGARRAATRTDPIARVRTRLRGVLR